MISNNSKNVVNINEIKLFDPNATLRTLRLMECQTDYVIGNQSEEIEAVYRVIHNRHGSKHI